MSTGTLTWNSSEVESVMSSPVTQVPKSNATFLACGAQSVKNIANGTSSTEHSENSDLNAFMYIVVVLLFYAVSMVFLMIKYIRREEEEATLDNYFTDFVKREQFSDGFSIRDERTCKTTHFIRTFYQKYGFLMTQSDGTHAKSLSNGDEVRANHGYKETAV